MPSWGTATLLEIIWTCCAGVGIGATGLGLWQAWRDAWALLDWPTPPRPAWHRHPATWLATARAAWQRRPRQLWRLALVFIRYESALLLVCAVFGLAGARALAAPPADPSDALDWGVLLVGVLFLVACAIVTVVSVQNRLARRAADNERNKP